MALSGSTLPDWRLRTFAGVAGGIAAVAAGLCWVVKAVAILATGQQPALLFELAPLLMACAILVLGQQLPPGKPRIVCAVVATTATVAGVAVLAGVSEFPAVSGVDPAVR
jgi:cytochrome bd-type quinol oxidase subunit 2